MMQHSTSTGDDIRQNGEGCARTNRKGRLLHLAVPLGLDHSGRIETARSSSSYSRRRRARQSPNAAVRWAPSHSRSCSRRAALTQGAKSASRMPSLLVSTAGECDEVPERVHRERCSGVEDDVTIGSGTTARCRGGRHEPKLGQGAKSHARSIKAAALAARTRAAPDSESAQAGKYNGSRQKRHPRDARNARQVSAYTRPARQSESVGLYHHWQCGGIAAWPPGALSNVVRPLLAGAAFPSAK